MTPPSSINAGGPGVAEVANQLRVLGVDAGGVLLVHTSWRTVRPVRGGPPALIDALRDAVGPNGTVVMPSWGADDDVPYDAATTSVADDLGVVAALFRQLPGVVRSTHPFAFAALGPRAGEIVGGSLPLPPHGSESPVGRVHQLDGQVLLVGVGHDADTTVHLAEVLAGVPYGTMKHCTVDEGGRARRIDYLENDHCCARFALVGDWLRARGAERSGPVGSATAIVTRSRDVVTTAVDHLREDPLVFLHAQGVCEECDIARASIGPTRTAPPA